VGARSSGRYCALGRSRAPAIPEICGYRRLPPLLPEVGIEPTRRFWDTPASRSASRTVTCAGAPTTCSLRTPAAPSAMGLASRRLSLACPGSRGRCLGQGRTRAREGTEVLKVLRWGRIRSSSGCACGTPCGSRLGLRELVRPYSAPCMQARSSHRSACSKCQCHLLGML